MTKEQLQDIKETLARATEITDTLKVLDEADPAKTGARAKFYDLNTNSAYLSNELLLTVLAIGRSQMIDQLLDELQAMHINTRTTDSVAPKDLSELVTPMLEQQFS